MPFRGRVRNPLPRIDNAANGGSSMPHRADLIWSASDLRIESGRSALVSGDGLEQGRHSLEQGAQGRCGLGRRLDHDVAARGTANLELREELAHLARRGQWRPPPKSSVALVRE